MQVPTIRIYKAGKEPMQVNESDAVAWFTKGWSQHPPVVEVKPESEPVPPPAPEPAPSKGKK